MADNSRQPPKQWEEPEEEIKTIEEFIWADWYMTKELSDTDFLSFREDYETYLDECGFWD